MAYRGGLDTVIEELATTMPHWVEGSAVITFDIIALHERVVLLRPRTASQ